MKFTDKELRSLANAIYAADPSGNYWIDDVCWQSSDPETYTSATLYFFSDRAGAVALRFFDLTTPALTSSSILFFCLQAMFPSRCDTELFKMRDKLNKKYFK